jgi:hypothetical protein
LASLGVSLDGRDSGQSDSVGCEPRHCASKDTLSELDLAHVCKCVLGRQQVPRFEIHFSEVLCMLQLMQQVINHGQWLSILEGNLVKSSIVDTHPPCSILLGYYDIR